MTDRKLDVAVGNSRKTKTWKNKKMAWAELCDRLAEVTRTPETVAEFKAMSLSQQSEVKDVGGFVGGYVNNGNRSDVRHRSVLALDADYADAGIWEDWAELIGNAAVVYSTHKHTREKPRLRLVVPLARDVSPDEYQAIGRRVAEILGIDKFDDTTYQPQRLMYWPSCSRDGEYVCERMDGELLDPDLILATYHDWRDVSAWPMSSRVAEVVRKTAAKQKDPLEKGGVIGAFCRAYTIHEAIEAYVPTYQRCDVPGRYTFTEGSTAAGVVTYEDKFSYSHHATDPASGQLCNAWDLVRLHKFGGLDAECEPDAKPNSRPSYQAMTELATEDPRVRAQLVEDRTAEATEDFATDPEPVQDGGNWRSKLKITSKGGIAQTIENAVTILKNDQKLAGVLAFDEMEHQIMAQASPPWRTVKAKSQWTDADDAALRYYLERVYGISGKDRIFDAVNVVAQENAYHPVRDYLEACKWDGVQRVDTLLIDYLGAEDSEYTRAVTRKTLVAAVARIFRPGCKFDYMLTLRGRQGLGKSQIIAKLGGEWFSDTFTTMQGKDSLEQVQGVWIMEVGELAGMRKAEAETIKLYISKQVDRFRPAYGRRLQDFPRQCIFVGTTNEAQFLRDSTGNRRFWVVDTPNAPSHNLWQDLTPETVAKIWAEAVQLYRAGEPLYLSGELEEIAREVQAGFEEDDPRIGLVADYLSRKLPTDWDSMDLYARRQWLETDAVGEVEREYVCGLEVFAEALGGNPERVDRYAIKEVHSLLAKQAGWRHQGGGLRTFKLYGRQKFYRKEKSL